MSAQQQPNFSHSVRAHAFLECTRLALKKLRALRTVGRESSLVQDYTWLDDNTPV